MATKQRQALRRALKAATVLLLPLALSAAIDVSCAYRCITESGFVLVKDGQTYYLYDCQTRLDGTYCFYR